MIWLEGFCVARCWMPNAPAYALARQVAGRTGQGLRGTMDRDPSFATMTTTLAAVDRRPVVRPRDPTTPAGIQPDRGMHARLDSQSIIILHPAVLFHPLDPLPLTPRALHFACSPHPSSASAASASHVYSPSYPSTRIRHRLSIVDIQRIQHLPFPVAARAYRIDRHVPHVQT